MRKLRITAFIDSLAFTLFVFLTTTGLLMFYRLPPGSGGWKSVWGFSRHQWGDLHFWMAMAFIALMLTHLYLHKKWIVSVVSGKIQGRQRRRMVIGFITALLLLGLAIAPLLSGVDTRV